MQKSIIEILGNEHKIYLWNKKEQEDFYKRNSLCFKEIMLEFYNIDYENNEKYKKLIIDEEIQEIFEKKIKTNNQNPAPSNINKIEEKKDNEIENNKNKTNNKENKSIFASSVSNGFYKRLKLNINMDELYKKQFELNERNTITSRNRKSNSKNNKNSILENMDIKKKINNSHSYNKRDIIKNNLINTNKNNYNIYSLNKDINRKDSSNNIIKKYSNISINNKFIPRIEAYNNFNKRRTINYMKPSENTYIERNNYSINKESNIKSESNSPIKFDVATANNNNISHISRINKFTNLNKINNGKERKDYSFSITENYNSELNKKSSEKKPYFRKLFHQNTIENYSSMNFNSTNKNLENEKIKYDINNIESSNRNNNIKITKYYTRINLKKPTNEILDTSINVGNENTYKTNNIINDNSQLIIASTRFRRTLNNISSNNINNNNNISEDIKKENNVIDKDNNKKEIEPYNKEFNKLNHIKRLTCLNFYRNSRNKISLKNTIFKLILQLF